MITPLCTCNILQDGTLQRSSYSCPVHVEVKSSHNKSEVVDHPKHYNQHPSGIECIDVVEHMSFNLGNAIKYIWRADFKGAPLDDLRKAKWYIDREIDKRRKINK